MISWLDDAQDEDDEFIEAAKAIRLLALDVDGVLTDGTIYIAADGECFKGFNAKDGMGISCALRNGLDVAIITGRKSEIIHRRAEELGITTIIEGAKDKREALRSLRRIRGLSVEEVAYVGDDLNDLPAFAESGLTFAPDDAAEDVYDAADIGLDNPGGRGAVREAIEYILAAQDKWEKIVASYEQAGQGPPRLPLRRELARQKDLEARLREREREVAAYTKV